MINRAKEKEREQRRKKENTEKREEKYAKEKRKTSKEEKTRREKEWKGKNSKCPKSECSDFGVFSFGSVCKITERLKSERFRSDFRCSVCSIWFVQFNF